MGSGGGAQTSLKSKNTVKSIPDLVVVAVAECAVICIKEIVHMCTLTAHPSLFSLCAVDTPDCHTSAGLALRARCTRLPFLVLSIHS